jgi:16S rRNA (adenine1518-N6/adenine1519-N6)-dimethyltransferase
MTHHGHNPRKRFGQNFLHDQGVIAQILANLNAKPGEHWVEIGPGQGALTAPLLAQGVSLDVVEIDRDLVAILQSKFADYSKINIHSADALKFDFARLAAPNEKLRVVGNLPYNISTPLLFHLLETTNCMADMVFMLQKEVVDRICASPGSKQYGRLSIMMQYYCQAECLFDVPPESFDPIPQVMSAVVRLVPYQTPLVDVKDKALFDKVVTQAFSQRRKTLRNSLKTVVASDRLIDLGIDPGARAEELSINEYAEICNSLISG